MGHVPDRTQLPMMVYLHVRSPSSNLRNHDSLAEASLNSRALNPDAPDSQNPTLKSRKFQAMSVTPHPTLDPVANQSPCLGFSADGLGREPRA